MHRRPLIDPSFVSVFPAVEDLRKQMSVKGAGQPAQIVHAVPAPGICTFEKMALPEVHYILPVVMHLKTGHIEGLN